MLVHFARLSLVLSLLGLPLISACGDGDSGDSESFDTFQDCFDDHHEEEMFTVQKAITICCLDHPIGANAAGVVCGATAATCDTYVTSSLGAGSGSGSGSDEVTAADITAACTDYVTQKGM
jgi:hypothetical protein